MRQVYFAEGVYLYELCAPGQGCLSPINFLDALESADWSYRTFLDVLLANRLWDGAIDEMENLWRAGNGVNNTLASVYMERNKPGDSDRALALFGQAVRLNPSDVGSHI